MSLTFTISSAPTKAYAEVKKPELDGEWVPRGEYADDGSISRFFGFNDATLLEVRCIRTAQLVNCSRTLNWEKEGFWTVVVRVLGPAFRIAGLLTSIVVVVTGVVLETPLLGEYTLQRSEEDRPGNALAFVTFAAWLIQHGMLTFANLLIRLGSPSHPERSKRWWLFRSIRPIQTAGGEPDPFFTLQALATFVLYLSGFAVSCLSTFILISETYNARVREFAILFAMFTFYMCISSLEDVTRIGSPLGVQEDSRMASRILAFRSMILVPLTLILSVWFIVLCDPPFQD